MRSASLYRILHCSHVPSLRQKKEARAPEILLPPPAFSYVLQTSQITNLKIFSKQSTCGNSRGLFISFQLTTCLSCQLTTCLSGLLTWYLCFQEHSYSVMDSPKKLKHKLDNVISELEDTKKSLQNVLDREKRFQKSLRKTIRELKDECLISQETANRLEAFCWEYCQESIE